MADKRKKRTGLAEPEVEGYDALFGVPEPVAAKRGATHPTESVDQPEDEDSKARKVKTSLYLSQEAHDLLYELKHTARKREGRVVPIGELIDKAVRDLAEKMNVAVEN